MNVLLPRVEVAKRTSLNGSTRLGSPFNSLNIGTRRDEFKLGTSR